MLLHFMRKGGQVGDIGTIENKDESIQIIDTKKKMV